MDRLHAAIAGFQTIDAEPACKEQAVKNLTRWLAEPDFAAYRPQLDWLIDQRQWGGLLDRFYQILPFGTGGRRGAVGIGPNRMNLWTLGASVQGHCEYLRERFPSTPTLAVALAYDVRQFEDQRKSYNPALPNPVLHLSSKRFAQHAACIYAANGIHAHISLAGGASDGPPSLAPPANGPNLLAGRASDGPPSLARPANGRGENWPRYLATPELSYAIRALRVQGGLNVSASHNPPDDNGGKFYDERGSQPIPPDDQIMADLVEEVTLIKDIPWADAVRSGRIHFLDDGLHRAYIDLCRKQSLVKPPRFDEMQIVFTPLHGVGAMTAMEVLVQQGFRVRPVEEQMEPNGQFPNVTKSPNPEFPESMDRAKALAESLNADLVLATDPDADRIGAMAPDYSSPLPLAGCASDGGPSLARPANDLGGIASFFRFINGNQLAALLTHFKLTKLTENGTMPPRPIVVTTLVTTQLVTRIARHFKAQVVNNLLVGFKYMANVLHSLEDTGSYEEIEGTPADFIIATEESHGFMLTPEIGDKDAGAAALLMAELALDCKRRFLPSPTGRGAIFEYLDKLARQFGYFHNELVNITMPGIEGKTLMRRMLDRLRQAPPKVIAGLSVVGCDDLLDENGWMGPFKGATDKAARNFLHFTLQPASTGGDIEAARIALRPSGTEPKAKAYIEVCSPPCPYGATEADWQKRCAAVDQQAKQLATEFLRMCD